MSSASSAKPKYDHAAQNHTRLSPACRLKLRRLGCRSRPSSTPSRTPEIFRRHAWLSCREFHDLNLRDVDEFILALEFVNDEFDHAADNRIRDKCLLGDEVVIHAFDQLSRVEQKRFVARANQPLARARPSRLILLRHTREPREFFQVQFPKHNFFLL